MERRKLGYAAAGVNGAKTVAPTRNWSGKRDSNPRPSAWKADALPTELLPLNGLQRKALEWGGEDLNLCRHTPADLQSAPFGRSGTSPRPTAGTYPIGPPPVKPSSAETSPLSRSPGEAAISQRPTGLSSLLGCSLGRLPFRGGQLPKIWIRLPALSRMITFARWPSFAGKGPNATWTPRATSCSSVLSRSFTANPDL